MKTITVLIISLGFAGTALGQFRLEITLRNPKDYPVTVSFNLGDIWETQNADQQNVIIAKDTSFTVEPGERRSVEVQGFCANASRSGPSGNILPTPVQVADEHRSQIRTQEELWNFLRRNRQGN